MFDVLIREASVRFGVGEKTLPLVQVMLACMTDQEDGGLPGFLEQFKAAGLGSVVQSWLGGGPVAKPITNTQLESVLGSSGGLLELLTSRLGVERDSATSALGYLLPPIVGMLTPGGNLPAALPAEVTRMAAAGASLLAAPEPGTLGGGLMKWLPWVVVVLVVLFALVYWASQHDSPSAPVAAPTPAASQADTGASAPATPASAPASSS